VGTRCPDPWRRTSSASPSGSFLRALRLDEKGDPQAAEAYRTAIAQGVSVADAWCNLGILESEAGRQAAAFDCFTRTLVESPHHFEAHYNLGNLYFDADDRRLARLHYELARRIDPEFADVHYNLGLVLFEEGLHKAAVHSFRKFLRIADEGDQRKAQRQDVLELIGILERPSSLAMTRVPQDVEPE